MVGVCDVAMPPTMVAMTVPLECARPQAVGDFPRPRPFACMMPWGGALRQVNFRIREFFAYLKRQRARQPPRCLACA
jgi:hypothetical protein